MNKAAINKHMISVLEYLKQQIEPVCTQNIAKELYPLLVKSNPNNWTMPDKLAASWALKQLTELYKLNCVNKIKNNVGCGAKVYWSYKKELPIIILKQTKI